MKDLTISQGYFLCGANDKGSIGGLNTERRVCLVAAALLELRLASCAQLDRKTVTVTAPLPAEQAHLRPLYDYLVEAGGTCKTEKLLRDYTYAATDTRLNALQTAIGASLVSLDLAQPVKTGLLKGKQGFLPCREAVAQVVARMREELLEPGQAGEETAILVILLDLGKSLKPYFSAFEQTQMKQTLRAMEKSPTGKMVREMVEYLQNLMSTVTTFMMLLS